MAAERTSGAPDEPARTGRARRRAGAHRGATRGPRSHNRATRRCAESRSRRPWIQPAAGLAALPGGLGRRTCAPARRVGGAGCAMGRSIEAIGAGGFERSIKAVASCACRYGVILQRNLLNDDASRNSTPAGPAIPRSTGSGCARVPVPDADVSRSGLEAELLHPAPERHGADVERRCSLPAISTKPLERALDGSTLLFLQVESVVAGAPRRLLGDFGW
jgi:hypothetical protein